MTQLQPAVGDRAPASLGVPESAPESIPGIETSPRARELVPTAWGRRVSLTRRALAIADALGLTLGLAGAMAVGATDSLERFALGLALLPVWILVFKLYGLYDRDTERISHSGLDDLPWLFHALLVGTILTWLYFKAIPVPSLTLAETTLFALLSLCLISLLRGLARRVIVSVMGPEGVVLVGGGATTATVAGKVLAHPEYGLSLIGLIVPAGDGDGHASISLPVLGSHTDLEEVLRRYRPDRVLVSRADLEEDEVLTMIDTCRAYSVRTSLLPKVVDSLGPSVIVDEVEGMTVLGINPPILSRSSRGVKRCFDCLVAGVSLLLLVPLLGVIALAIRLDSRGPALFRQQRVGRGGKRFDLVKFRTMARDAEDQRAKLVAQSRDPHWLHLDADPRITRVGAFLRRTSLDELPQLWNVLRGDMSLVGPRPLPVAEDDHVLGRMRGRLDLVPGITGLWQVLGRNRIPFEEMVKLDYVYVTNWSLWMDIRLLLRTAPVVLTRRGAK